MGFIDRVLGKDPPEPRRAAAPAAAGSPDEQALERYRYMLKTAPPETIEQAHAEAFAQLSPDQRRQALARLAEAAPAQEQAAVAATSPDDERAMGRLATRAEVRQPGFMERTFGGGGMGGGSLLGSFAMGFAGSMIAQSFFSSMGADNADNADNAGNAGEADDATADADGGDSAMGDIGDGGFDV